VVRELSRLGTEVESLAMCYCFKAMKPYCVFFNSNQSLSS